MQNQRFTGELRMKAVAHSWSGAMFSLANGQHPITGVISGAASSVVSSGIGSAVHRGVGQLGAGGSAIMIVGGGLSGGIGARLSGGDFWVGAAHGLMVSGLNHVAHSLFQGGPGDPPTNGKVNVKTSKNLIKELICKCIQEYSTNPAADMKNVIVDNIFNDGWVGGQYEAVVTLDGHKYKVYVDGLHSSVSTGMTKVAYSHNLERSLYGGAEYGRAGFYVAGQNGAQLVSISAPINSAASHYLKELYILYRDH